MKKSFTSLFKKPFSGTLEDNGVKFSFTAQFINKELVKCTGNISGKTPHQCDRCGEELELDLNEDIEVLVSDGVAKPTENLQNIIEFFDGDVNFSELFTSELEAIKSDYFYCNKCKN